METNKIYNMDCLEGMKLIPDKTVDMILSDLPQGITQNDWDKVIPFNELWEQYNRIIKNNGAIVLFGNGMFTSELMQSNRKFWRYNIIWEKTKPTGFLNANNMPLRIHEDICVFYKKRPLYFPQKTKGHRPVHTYTKHTPDGSNYGKTKTGISGGGSTERFPRSIITFSTDTQKSSIHPTQKPVELCSYLIRTYTKENEIILDSCTGSGAVPVACIKMNRRYIAFEINENYYQKAVLRIKQYKNDFNSGAAGNINPKL